MNSRVFLPADVNEDTPKIKIPNMRDFFSKRKLPRKHVFVYSFVRYFYMFQFNFRDAGLHHFRLLTIALEIGHGWSTQEVWSCLMVGSVVMFSAYVFTEFAICYLYWHPERRIYTVYPRFTKSTGFQKLIGVDSISTSILQLGWEPTPRHTYLDTFSWRDQFHISAFTNFCS